MSAAAAAPTTVNEPVSVLVFCRSAVWLALPVAQVESLRIWEEPKPLPQSPSHLLGLLAHDMRALPIVDLADFLGLPRAAQLSEDERLLRRIIVVQADDMRVGLTCDRTTGVMTIEPGAAREPSALHVGRLRDFLDAELEGDETIIGLLRLAALLEAARIR